MPVGSRAAGAQQVVLPQAARLHLQFGALVQYLEAKKNAHTHTHTHTEMHS